MLPRKWHRGHQMSVTPRADRWHPASDRRIRVCNILRRHKILFGSGLKIMRIVFHRARGRSENPNKKGI